MDRLDADWLRAAETRNLLACLADAGHVAYAVGGCVRNSLLGLPPADVDVATDARPEEVMALAEAAGAKSIPTGIDHGSVTVVWSGTPFDVTTFRRDVRTHGRRAEVRYSDRMEDDAARRDFTMNAIYVDADGTIHDPVGGLPDVRARRLRFVGDPATRIREDYLRILRFFRFHALYADPAGGFDPDALSACVEGVDGIDGLSRERIGAETRKLLSARDPTQTVEAMEKAGILIRFLPGADASGLGRLAHLERLSGTPPGWIRRLAVLGPESPGKTLRLSRKEATEYAGLRAAASSAMEPRELGYRLGALGGRDALLVRAALSGKEPSPGALDAVDRGADRNFPVAAKDLIHRHSGPELGAKLAELEQRWIDSDFQLDRDGLVG